MYVYVVHVYEIFRGLNAQEHIAAEPFKKYIYLKMVNGTASIFCLLKSTISSFILLLAGCFLSNKVHLLFVSYFISTRALDHDLLSTSPSSFHWLPGAAHIRFQTLVLAYKASLPGPHTYLKAVLIPPFSITSRQNDWFNLPSCKVQPYSWRTSLFFTVFPVLLPSFQHVKGC